MKRFIKSKLSEYLKSKEILNLKSFRCLNLNHEDKHPSMSYKNNRVKCFSCEASYDILDLIKMIYGFNNFKDAYNKALELYSINTTPQDNLINEKNNEKDYTHFYAEVHKKINETDYFNKRGLNFKKVEKFNLGYHPNFKINDNTWEAVIIPTSRDTFNDPPHLLYISS